MRGSSLVCVCMCPALPHLLVRNLHDVVGARVVLCPIPSPGLCWTWSQTTGGGTSRRTSAPPLHRLPHAPPQHPAHAVAYRLCGDQDRVLLPGGCLPLTAPQLARIPVSMGESRRGVWCLRCAHDLHAASRVRGPAPCDHTSSHSHRRPFPPVSVRGRLLFL